MINIKNSTCEEEVFTKKVRLLPVSFENLNFEKPRVAAVQHPSITRGNRRAVRGVLLLTIHLLFLKKFNQPSLHLLHSSNSLI